MTFVFLRGCPPLFGFVAKELFYEAKQEAPRAGQLLAVASFAGSALVAAAAGLVGWRPFFGRARGTPKHPHEARPALWLGPVLLASTSVALGLLPDALAVPIVQPAASAMRGEHTEVVLRLWIGLSPAFVQSLLMLAVGALLYAAHARALRLLEPLRGLSSWGPERVYEAVLGGTVAFAKAQTRLLLVSGVYYPIDVLPPLLQKLAVFSPATYVLGGTRQALLAGTPTRELWPFIWPTLVMGLIAIPLGLWVFVTGRALRKTHREAAPQRIMGGGGWEFLTALSLAPAW